jgi:O-antigen/teichoic acid export membrane protein
LTPSTGGVPEGVQQTTPQIGLGLARMRGTLGQGVLFAAATAVVSLLSAVVKALLARHLTTSEFGSFSFALAFLLLAAMVFEFGLFLPAARMAARADEAARREIVGASLLTYAVVGFAFCATVFGSSFVVDSWFNVTCGSALRIIAPVAFAFPFVQLALWLAQGLGRLHVYSLTSVLSQVILVGSIVVLVQLDDRPGITWPLLLQSLAMVAGWSVFVFWLRPGFRQARGYARALVRDAKAFGFQVYVGRLLSIGTYNIDVLMVAAFTNARQVGLYALAGALTAASGLAVAGMSNALFPQMVDTARLRREWIVLAWVIGLVLAVAVWLLARPFFRLLFSPAYSDAARYVLPLALAQVVRGVTGLYNNFLSAQGRGRDLRNAGLILTVSNLALNFALIPTWGAMGAAWASFGALTINYFAHVYFYRRASEPSRQVGAAPDALGAPISGLGIPVVAASTEELVAMTSAPRRTPVAALKNTMDRVTASHLVWAFVAIGVGLRSLQYGLNPSLSGDEALLALNVTRRSVHGLLGVLDFNQAAPLGFLLLEKGATLFGAGEFWLRLVPFAAAVGAMVAFPLMARHVFGRWGLVLAVGLFALSDSLIDYAGTAKQYSVDVAAVVLLSGLAFRVLARESMTRFGVLIATGVAAVWLSHPAAFVLFAIGATLLVTFARREHRASVYAMGGGSVLWLGSFAIAYSLSSKGVSNVASSFSGSGSFLGSASAVHEYFGIFRFDAGISHFSLFGFQDLGKVGAAAAALLFVLGCFWLCRTKPAYAAVVFGPVIVGLVASAFYKYPLVARTVLFAAPAAVIGTTAGVVVLLSVVRRPSAAATAVVATAMVALSLVIPVVRHLDSPRKREELRPVLRYLAHAERSGDVLYLYYPSQYAFRYYLSCRCLDQVVAGPRSRGLWPLTRFVGGSDQWAPALVSEPPSFRVGVFRGGEPSLYASDFRSLKGRRRLWILISDVSYSDRARLLGELDALGHRRLAFKPGREEGAAGVYLYDLR